MAKILQWWCSKYHGDDQNITQLIVRILKWWCSKYYSDDQIIRLSVDCQNIREQRNHVLKYESDCVIIGIGIKKWIMEGFERDCFVEFLSSTLQLNGNILSVLEQVFIPTVSHMKIANVHVGTKYQNVRIALQFS